MLSKRERYIAMATGAAVLLCGLDYFVLTPLLDGREELAVKHAKLAHEWQADQAMMNNNRKATKQWEKLHAIAAPPNDPSTAERNLVNAISGWAEDARLSLRSIRPDRTSDNQDLHEMTFQTTAQGSMYAMAQFIYRAETANIPARVREVQLSSNSESADNLQMQIRISTLWEDAKGGAGGAAGDTGELPAVLQEGEP